MEHTTDSHGSMNELTVAPQQILSAGATNIFNFFLMSLLIHSSGRCCPFKVTKLLTITVEILHLLHLQQHCRQVLALTATAAAAAVFYMINIIQHTPQLRFSILQFTLGNSFILTLITSLLLCVTVTKELCCRYYIDSSFS